MTTRHYEPDCCCLGPQGCWALPGAFVEDYESFFIAARRVLVDQTTLGGTGTGGPDDNGGVRLTSVAAFGDPARDPRGWCAAYERVRIHT